MERDLRRFFSKYTSMTNIKTNQLPKCEQDIEEVLKYFAEAAKLGQTEALFNLGVCYLEGKCTGENTTLGLQFIQEAVDEYEIIGLSQEAA